MWRMWAYHWFEYMKRWRRRFVILTDLYIGTSYVIESKLCVHSHSIWMSMFLIHDRHDHSPYLMISIHSIGTKQLPTIKEQKKESVIYDIYRIYKMENVVADWTRCITVNDLIARWYIDLSPVFFFYFVSCICSESVLLWDVDCIEQRVQCHYLSLICVSNAVE